MLNAGVSRKIGEIYHHCVREHTRQRECVINGRQIGFEEERNTMRVLLQRTRAELVEDVPSAHVAERDRVHATYGNILSLMQISSMRTHVRRNHKLKCI